MEKLEDVLELEAVLGAERQDDRLLVRGRLELEAEPHAEPLAQGEAPRPIDARAEGRVNDELHASAFVEKALEDHARRRRHGAETLASGLGVLGDLEGRGPGQRRAARLRQERRGVFVAGGALIPQPADLGRELPSPSRSLAEPERQGGRCALRVGHAHDAGLHAQHAPGRVAELEHVAAARLDRPVLVDGADERPLGLEANLVVGRVRDCASRQKRRQFRAARPHQAPLHAVPVQQRPPAPRVQCHDAVEIGARKIAIGPRAPRQIEEAVLRPGLDGAGRHDLLSEDVERLRRRRRPVEGALADAPQQGGAFDELVERQRKDAAARHARKTVAGAPDALEERRDRTRGPDLDDEVHVADVDAELERRGGDEGPEGPCLQALLGIQPTRLREASVVAGDGIFAEQLRELGRDAFGHLARVDEHEGRPMLANELGHARIDLFPLLVRAHGGKRRGWHLDAEIEIPKRPRVHENAFPASADEEPPDFVERLLGGRQANPLDLPSGEGLEPFEREGQMAAALVAHDRMDLVHDDRRDRAEHRPATRRCREGCRAIPASSPGCAAAGGPSPRARRTWCLPCGRGRGPAERRDRGRGSPPAATADSSGRRWREREGERRREAASRLAGLLPGESACRVPRETPRASCPTRSERRSACAGLPGWASSPGPGGRGLAEACPEPFANRRMKGIESTHG